MFDVLSTGKEGYRFVIVCAHGDFIVLPYRETYKSILSLQLLSTRRDGRIDGVQPSLAEGREFLNLAESKQ